MQGHSRSKKPTQGLGFKMQFSDKRHPGSWETGLVPGLGQGKWKMSLSHTVAAEK